MKEKLVDQLKRHEGFRSQPYKDTKGKLTIGYGRNLDDVGISKEEALSLLDNDIDWAIEDAKSLFPTFDSLSDIRQAVLCNMAFNMGSPRLAGFRKMRQAILDGDVEETCKQMLESKWAKEDVGYRAIELEALYRRG